MSHDLFALVTTWTALLVELLHIIQLLVHALSANLPSSGNCILPQLPITSIISREFVESPHSTRPSRAAGEDHHEKWQEAMVETVEAMEKWEALDAFWEQNWSPGLSRHPCRMAAVMQPTNEQIFNHVQSLSLNHHYHNNIVTIIKTVRFRDNPIFSP